MDPTLPLSVRVATAILEGFDRHYALFRYVAQRAKPLFEDGDWPAVQQSARERIAFYDERVAECVTRLEAEFGIAAVSHAERSGDPAKDVERLWQQVKQDYVTLIVDHHQPECAETFFNSVCCKILHRDYFHNGLIFVRPAVATEHMDSDPPSYRCYYPVTHGLKKTLIRMVADFGLACPFANIERDVRCVIRAGLNALPRGRFRVDADCQLHVLSTLFFRNKGAYIIGRLVNGNTPYPFAIPVLRDSKGRLYLDTLLFAQNELAVLFSFTRAYFLVDMDAPAAYVSFLRTVLPNKPKAELYTMIGLQKQGKTLFYRDFLHHLRHSEDQFVIAPGIKGLVMSVFTLPSYPYVFKVIKDRIAKDGMDRAHVQGKYQLVKMHDRVGRMADTWEYSQVALPRHRVAPEVVEELRTLAPSMIEEDGENLIIQHVYIERRMVPLNLYLRHATDSQVDHAIKEYGQAIKQLAAANIFPGDMLFKNFGVTRLGRVVFYDYDEIQYMTEINFRAIPPAPTPEAELASEPWYAVGPNDVFPEEFATFLLGDPRVRAAFRKHHADLLDAGFWQRKQQRIASGHVEDVFPYDEARRFGHARKRRGQVAA
jgi:isocitrate dehydrogenase kinase/phosphatase